MMASSTEHKVEGGDRRSKHRAAFIQRWAEGELRAQPEIDLGVTATSAFSNAARAAGLTLG